MNSSDKTWLVYIVECADSTLYTGITNNFDRRISQHNAGEGAKYLKGRTPVQPVYVEMGHNRSSASRREIYIKQLTRQSKLKLIRSVSNEIKKAREKQFSCVSKKPVF